MVWHYVLQNLATGNFFYGQTKDTRKDDRHKDGDYTKLIARLGSIGSRTSHDLV